MSLGFVCRVVIGGVCVDPNFCDARGVSSIERSLRRAETEWEFRIRLLMRESSSGPATGVALAERPPGGGGDVDSDDSSQVEVNDGVDETADEEPAADEPTDEDETATAEEEPAEVEAPSEEVTDSDDATSDERPADEEEPAAAKPRKRVRTRKRNAVEGSAEE